MTLRYWIFIYFLLLSSPSNGQTEIDSLWQLAQIEKNDTIQIDLLLQVAEKLRYQDIERSDSLVGLTLRSSEKIKFITGIEKSLSLMGGNYVIKGDYDRSLEYVEKSLAFAEKHSLGYPRIKALNLRGIIEYYRGLYQKGIETNLEILSLVDTYGQPRNKLSAYNNIGINYEKLSEFDKAIEYYNKALEMARDLDNQYVMASVNANIGVIFKNRGNLEEAKKRFTNSIAIAEQINNKGLLIDELQNLTEVFISEGQIDTARILNNRAYSESLEINDQNGLIRSFLIEGKINALALRYDIAITSFRKALVLANKNGDKEQLLHIYENLHTNFLQINKYDSAYLYLTKFSLVKDSIFDTEKTNELTRLETAYRVAEKDKEILTQQIEIERKTRQRNLFLISAIVFIILGISIYLITRRMIRDQKQIALQREILHTQEIDKLQKEKRIGSLDAMLHGQEAERRRIATDLHDSLGSLLASVKLHYHALFRGSSKDDPRVAKTENLIDEACDEVRRISHNMMPHSLLEVGLIEALKDLAHDYAENNNWDLSLHMEGVDYYLQNHQEDTIFRIIQEIITNISRHASANKVGMKIYREEDLLRISVSDDGAGFTSSGFDSEGIGLKNIRSRVDYLNGKIQIDTALQQGTRFEIQIPLDISSI